MANTLFITPEDVKKRTPMGGNVDTDSYNQSIYHVQRSELLPIIGDGLYDRIKLAVDAFNENGTPIPDPINELLKGPMRDCIALYAAADWSLNSNYNMTNGGTSGYSPTNGFAISTDEIIRNTTRLEHKASFYGRELIKFLNNNQNIYPEWNGTTTSSNFLGFEMDDTNDCSEWT